MQLWRGGLLELSRYTLYHRTTRTCCSYSVSKPSLPLLWWRMGRAPAQGAWLGAGLTVLGTVLVLLR